MTSTAATAAGGTRARSRHRALGEAEWRRRWNALPETTHPLPEWLRPLGCATSTRPTAKDGDPPRLDANLGGLLEIAARATTLLELRASCGTRGVLACFALADRRDGSVTGLKRDLLSVDGGRSLQPLPGVQVSGLAVERWVAAVMALVPPDREHRARGSVRLPVEQAFALVDGARRRQDLSWDELAAQLGDGQPLGVLRSLARGLRGTLDVRISGADRPGWAFASWLLSDEGWVSVRARGTEVVHVPVSRSAIRARVLAGLSAEVGRHG